jgi:hypothetical protein
LNAKGIETGFAEKFEKEEFYRLYVTNPKVPELYVMPALKTKPGKDFAVFAPVRDLKKRFRCWHEVGSAQWSACDKGIYVSIRHQEVDHLIVLEPANFPYWKIDARK